jgi:hypothetical protein
LCYFLVICCSWRAVSSYCCILFSHETKIRAVIGYCHMEYKPAKMTNDKTGSFISLDSTSVRQLSTVCFWDKSRFNLRLNDDRIFVYRHSGERYTDCRYDPCSPNSSPSALCLLLGMHVTPRADKISHGLCLFLRYLYTFTMIPLFALLAPDHELPSIWLPTNTIKLTPVDL